MHIIPVVRGFVFNLLFLTCTGYKPIIFMHGLLAGKSELTHFKGFVDKYHPGTNITFIDDFEYSSSLRPLWIQVRAIKIRMAGVMADHPEGVHLVCFSQGGLICRGIAETMTNHNIINFISLSSPQGGQFGDTSYLAHILPGYVKKDLYKFFYTKKGQGLLSIANYWNDPYHGTLYRKWSAYLAVINNQNSTSDSSSSEYRSNFIRLKNLILVGGPDDGVIAPWQSSHFGTYNETEGIVEMKEQDFFMNDSFGLRTLNERGSLHIYSVPGVQHTQWHKNVTVFRDCIEPWLS